MGHRGLKVGRTTPRTFVSRIRELVAGHATLSTVAEGLLAAPGVGTIVALTYASAIDDPGRFRSSKAVGAHFGLTPKKYQSGETDVTGRISKIGDGTQPLWSNAPLGRAF